MSVFEDNALKTVHNLHRKGLNAASIAKMVGLSVATVKQMVLLVPRPKTRKKKT